MKRAILTGLLVCAVAAAVVGGQGAGPAADARQAILDTDVAFDRATAERGAEGFAAFLADDVVTIRPDRPLIHGRQALVDLWRPLLGDPAVKIRWRPLHAEVARGGDLGFTVGSYEITRRDAEGARIVGSGKYVTIWRKQPDGSWKVAFDSGVEDARPGTP